MRDMAEEYRIDISIGATDNTGPALQSASKRVTAFEKSMERTEKQLQRMDRTRWELTIHAVDRASSVILAVNRRAWALTRGAYTITLRAVDYATKPIRAVGSALTSVLGLVGIAGGTWGGIVQPLKLAGEFQQTEMAFETLLGSAERAQRFMREAYEFARVTPFDTEGVLEASRLLLAFGFQAEQIIPMLTTIGDAASGLGKGAEGVERIVWALGQMRAKGRVQMEELMQLQELGVDVNRYLQEELGLTEKQIGRIGELGLSSTKAIEAILSGMAKQFGGQMERQSQSFMGLLNTIKETFNTRILLRWGEGLRLGIQPHLRRLVEWVETNQETVERWGATLQELGQRAGEWIMEKFGAAIQWVQDLLASPDWQTAEGFWGHLEVAWDKFWADHGERFFNKAGEQIKAAILAGMGTAWDWFKGIQGTPGGFALDALLLAEMLPGLSAMFTIGGGIARGGRNVWRWLRGLRGGAAAAGAATAAASAVGASSAVSAQAATAAQAAATAGRVVEIVGPSGQVLSRVAQEADDVLRAAGAAASKGSRALGSFGRFAGALGKVGRFAGPAAAVLGTGLALLGAAGAENKGQAIGGALGGGLGGWGGAAAGAALGSAVLPGIGTVIGGLLGGLAGGFGGEWLGGKIGTAVANRSQAAPVTTTATTPTVVVHVTAQPVYRIETTTDAQSVLRVIRRHQREIADTLADEIAEAVETVFSNMTRRPSVTQRALGVIPM